MRVLITGALGFIGKNLHLHLAARQDIEVFCFNRGHDEAQLSELLIGVDYIFHLAGINRTPDPGDFFLGNTCLMRTLCRAIEVSAVSTGKKPTVIYASSIQAECNSPYGKSKWSAEETLFALSRDHQVPVHVFRLPNVFGKWSKPNYNSVVATFCYNIARGLPIHVNDAAAPITLVYVDDVVARFVQLMDGADVTVGSRNFEVVTPQYSTTVGALAAQIQALNESRTTLMTGHVGSGLGRALHATYLSYLPVECFAYPLPQYRDSRGVFVEMLKTPETGQFSYFKAHPGMTRGGHYHHSKTEKFLVVQGRARFKFRHMLTNEAFEQVTSGELPQVVESVPGWTHDITNIGASEMIVLLWASEVFDRNRPDTFACPL